MLLEARDTRVTEGCRCGEEMDTFEVLAWDNCLGAQNIVCALDCDLLGVLFWDDIANSLY